ncbi:MAG: hypothetical protein WDA75_24690 [Candidatus Latescibacterota bacterium]|jgi:hypothetical protein
MLRIGWASRDFTPTRPALLMGQMHARTARAAADSLTVTALALDQGEPGRAAILVSCDLVMIPPALQARVRHLLQATEPGAPLEAVVLCATHTHDSLVLEDGFYPPPESGVMTAAECLERVAVQAAEAAAQAWRERVPRLLGRAFAHAVVGHCRRAVYAGGAARMYGKTDQPDFAWIEAGEDHSLDLLFIWEPDGRLAGVVLDLPCPSQVEEHLSLFSADFWHDVRVELRQRFGQHLQVLPLCGAAGDQSPHFLLYGREEEEMRRRRGLTERQEIAQRVGDAVTRALACSLPAADEPVVAHACRTLNLTSRQVTAAEAAWARSEHERAVQGGMPAGSWWPQRLLNAVAAHTQGKALEAEPVEIHAVRLGDAVIATNPFELYLDYGWRIKARSPAAQTLVVQLAAGKGWYLPTARAIEGGHYGAHPVVAPIGAEGGQELVEATLALLSDLFAPTA